MDYNFRDLGIDNPDKYNPSLWKGTNLLGKSLDKVRFAIKYGKTVMSDL